MQSNPQTQNAFYRFYLIGFFLILALPLLCIPPWFTPSDWGKTIVFRIVLSVLIFFFIYQLLFQKEKINSVWRKIRQNSAALPFWLLVSLLGIYFLATLFSQDILFSFWGSPYRSGGFLNFAFYIIFAILAFLILSRNDWQKIWDFSIFIGILVSIIAVLQEFGLFSKVLIPFSGRPPSTIGGPTFLAAYLLLLTFIALSFFLKERKIKKRLFYFFALLLFLFVILLTGTRAAYFGLFVGFFYFLFSWSINFCPPKKKILFLGLKILVGILLITVAYGVYYINNQPLLPEFVENNEILKQAVTRLSITFLINEPRFSAWKVAFEAVKAKPILGYGPENFNIGFDKYYDPSLPLITKDWGSWWDRAHNFLFEISVTAGIPALIIYLSLFAVLFWQLQKLKNHQRQSAIIGEKQNSIVTHGIQATFIGYLATNFFTFDVYSTYLISFLLIVYSLHLISSNQISINRQSQYQSVSNKLQKYKKPIIFILSIFFIWFIWFCNLRPLQINAQINRARYSVNNKKCDQGLEIMENLLSQKSHIDSYLRLKYIDFMKDCAGFYPKKNYEYAKKGVEILKYSAEVRPKFTRNWILLGDFTNVLIEKEKDPEQREKLIKESEHYFEKARELSPRHQEILIGWAKTYLVTKDYQKMKEKTEECLDLNKEISTCWWYLGLSEIFLKENDSAEEHLALAEEKMYPVRSLTSLNQLVVAYSANENYKKLVPVYLELIALIPQEPQFHASLAFVYRGLGEYKKAREEALIFLDLKPEAKDEVELFLKTL